MAIVFNLGFNFTDKCMATFNLKEVGINLESATKSMKPGKEYRSTKLQVMDLKMRSLILEKLYTAGATYI